MTPEAPRNPVPPHPAPSNPALLNRLDSHRFAQFSLRTLLYLTAAVAVALATWRLAGISGLLTFVFGAISCVPLILLGGRLRGSYALAWAVVYGPFLGMAAYALVYVSCDHCKNAAWSLMPFGPGLVPADLAARAAGITRNEFQFAVALLLAVVFLGTLTWLLASWRWRFGIPIAVTAMAMSAWCALAVLSLIRA